jgi:hypothetical protein
MTRFRIGSRSVPGQRANTPGRVHGILPANAGISYAAQDRIDLLTSAATRRASEAISGIDSVQLFIFQPKRGGKACACGTQATYDTTADESPNPHVLGIVEDPADDMSGVGSSLKVHVRDVSATDHHMRHTNKNRPDHRFSEEDIFDEEVIPPASSTSGSTNPYVVGSTSTGPYEGEAHGGLHAGSYDHELPDGPEFGEELLDEYSQGDAWNPESILQDNAYVLGSTVNTCPVCMGNGVLGGYNLLGATRMILSSVNVTAENVLGEEHNEGQVPFYTLEPNESLEWGDLNCPNYFQFGWAAAYHYRRASSVTIQYTLDTGPTPTWVTIKNIGTLSEVALDDLRIRVVNLTTEAVKFTHLDVTLFHNEYRGQLTNFNEQAGSSTAVKGDGVEITLPPEVGKISRNSLIGDNKHRLMWRVTNLTPVVTAKGQVISCTATTEVMEPALVETHLFPLYSADGNSQLIYGAGVEPVQGQR